jgi:hypothetical protein
MLPKVKFWDKHDGRYLIKQCQAESKEDFNVLKNLLEAYGIRTAITDYQHVFEGSIVESIDYVLKHAATTLALAESVENDEPILVPAGKTGKKK